MGGHSIKEEICFEMKTLPFLICLVPLAPAFLVCMYSAPISSLPLSIFSIRWRSSTPTHPPSVPSKDKLLTSVKAFLINRGIRHGMSSGVQRLLIKGVGEPGHTSPLVYLSGQFSTFPSPKCPWQRLLSPLATISSYALWRVQIGDDATKGAAGN